MEYSSDKLPFHALDIYRISAPYHTKPKERIAGEFDSFINNKRCPQPKASPKFGNAQQLGITRQAVSQGTKYRHYRGDNRYNIERDKLDIESLKRVRKENEHSTALLLNYKDKNSTLGPKDDISGSVLFEKSTAEVMKDARDSLNKSYDYKKIAQFQQNHLQLPSRVCAKEKSVLAERCIKNKEIEIGFPKSVKHIAEPFDAWKENGFQKTSDKRDRAARIEEELKKIQKGGHGGRGRIQGLFEEIIMEVPYYGKALKLIKDLYETKISQLNERVGRHDIKHKEYKELAEKEKRAREEAEKKNEALRNEVKRQIMYVENQKSMIKDLKGRLDCESTKELHTYAGRHANPRENNNFKERAKLDKIMVPPLDLSKLSRGDKGSGKYRADIDLDFNDLKVGMKEKEKKVCVSVLLDDINPEY